MELASGPMTPAKSLTKAWNWSPSSSASVWNAAAGEAKRRQRINSVAVRGINFHCSSQKERD